MRLQGWATLKDSSRRQATRILKSTKNSAIDNVNSARRACNCLALHRLQGPRRGTGKKQKQEKEKVNCECEEPKILPIHKAHRTSYFLTASMQFCSQCTGRVRVVARRLASSARCPSAQRLAQARQRLPAQQCPLVWQERQGRPQGVIGVARQEPSLRRAPLAAQQKDTARRMQGSIRAVREGG